jgi:hypothetical protein
MVNSLPPFRGAGRRLQPFVLPLCRRSFCTHLSGVSLLPDVPSTLNFLASYPKAHTDALNLKSPLPHGKGRCGSPLGDARSLPVF